MRMSKWLAPICSVTLLHLDLVSAQMDEFHEEEQVANHYEHYSHHDMEQQYTDENHNDLEPEHAGFESEDTPDPTAPSLDIRYSAIPEEDTAKLSYDADSQIPPALSDPDHDDDLLLQTRATLIKQQVKRVGLGVDQLKQILLELQEEEEVTERSENGFTSFESADADDDRTLLDIFGEVAKEYMTKKLIPDSDPECRWDWQNLRCEAACDCELRFKRGDYHLGRACRLRTIPIFHCDESKLNPIVSKRFVSLVQQTFQILGEKIQRIVGKVSEPFCKDLVRLHASLGNHCLPRGRLPAKTVAERMLCGSIRFTVCPDETADDTMHQSFVHHQ